MPDKQAVRRGSVFAQEAPLQISTLEDIGGGKTKFTIHTLAESVADRDGVVMSRREKGVVESHERLDEVLREMKGK